MNTTAQGIVVTLVHVVALAAITTLLALSKVDQTAGFGLIAAIVGLAAPSSVQSLSNTPTVKAVPVTFPTQAPTPIPAPPVPPVPPVTP